MDVIRAVDFSKSGFLENQFSNDDRILERFSNFFYQNFLLYTNLAIYNNYYNTNQ